MSAPDKIDVLAVLAQDAYDANAYRGVIGADKASRATQKQASDEARAAVAELVEADLAVDEAEADLRRMALAGPRLHSYGTGWEVRDAATMRAMEATLKSTHDRRRAALVRFGCQP